MSDDFVLNVRQIAQYPAASSVNPAVGDVLLLQAGGLGGPYNSLDPRVLFDTALANGGWLQLAPAPDGGIAFNGAALAYETGSGFVFSETVNVPSLNSLGDIFVNGAALASQDWVQAIFDALALQGQVFSFNGRNGNVQLTDQDILRAGGVLQINPTFGGVVTVPTLWNFNDRTDSAASTAWVQGAILNAGINGCIVSSINGRGGTVILNTDDITIGTTTPGPVNGAYARANTPPAGDTSSRIATTMFVDYAMADLNEQILSEINNIASGLDSIYAPINSPQFTGIPTAPTAPSGTITGQLATTAFVADAVANSVAGVSTFEGRTGDVTLEIGDITTAGGAPILSPNFTGVPTATTQAPGDNSTRLATTAFVQAAIAALAAGVTSFNTRTGSVVLTATDVTGVGGALLASPVFSGTPTAPTPAAGNSSTQIATTAFVANAISVLPAPVQSFNGRTGAVQFQSSDLSAVGGALLTSPAFVGTPVAPTATAGTSNTQLATTAFVQQAIASQVAGVASFNGRTGAVTLTAGDISGATGALVASPTFTGVPAAPTAAPGTNSTQVATTAFVTAAVAAAAGAGVSSFNTRTGAVSLTAADLSAVGGALLGSPAFSGTPTSTTATPGDSTTRIATTAFVQNAIATSGGVTTFNGRAGAVTLALADIANAGSAILTVSNVPPTGTYATPNQAFWWDNVGGNLYVNYNDGNSTQWVIANSTPGPAGPQGSTGATGPQGNTGATGAPGTNGVNGASLPPTITRIATTGSGTFTPQATSHWMRVRMVAGGGGGGAAGGGGGMTAGGASVFGPMTCGGGGAATVPQGGVGGTVSGTPDAGMTTLISQAGGAGGGTGTYAQYSAGGMGGNSVLGGGGGGGGQAGGRAGAPNSGSGGGGGGMAGSSGPGGAGGGAGAFLELVITAIAATYSYTVGAGGNAGSGAGAGGSGVIIIEEY